MHVDICQTYMPVLCQEYMHFFCLKLNSQKAQPAQHTTAGAPWSGLAGARPERRGPERLDTSKESGHFLNKSVAFSLAHPHIFFVLFTKTSTICSAYYTFILLSCGFSGVRGPSSSLISQLTFSPKAPPTPLQCLLRG